MIEKVEIIKNRVAKVEYAKCETLVCTSHNGVYDLEIYDTTTGRRYIKDICENADLETINNYAGEYGIEFVPADK